jgi:UDP:flavonoid glycosyltransferase YjiC (YdhE family)
MILVLGPRIPKSSVRIPAEVEVFGHYPRLYELFASCDVAVVQCGASSTTELSALRTQFIYFPIEGHFEQELVASRLGRYGAGKRMSLKTTTPEMLAEAIYKLYGHPITWGYMPVDGASKAANHILQVLDELEVGKNSR